MEGNELVIKLEQRDWERLQKLSERNGEPIEKLAARLLAADLADIFNKPTDTIISPEARKIYDSFIAGRTQHKPVTEVIASSAQEIGAPALLTQ